MENIMPSTNAGGWTEFSAPISKEALAVFTKAVSPLLGVSYKPIAVATQVVSGINYQFFSNAKAVYPGAHNYAVIIHIYAPATGEPHITSINTITP